MKAKKHLEKVLNAEIWREEKHEDNRLNSELIIPIHDMGDVTASLLPKIFQIMLKKKLYQMQDVS